MMTDLRYESSVTKPHRNVNLQNHVIELDWDKKEEGRREMEGSIKKRVEKRGEWEGYQW
jgi:hypothetical protein